MHFHNAISTGAAAGNAPLDGYFMESLMVFQHRIAHANVSPSAYNRKNVSSKRFFPIRCHALTRSRFRSSVVDRRDTGSAPLRILHSAIRVVKIVTDDNFCFNEIGPLEFFAR